MLWSMAIDPQAARYPGSRDPRWWQAYTHRWWRRWERPGSERRRRSSRIRRRLSAMFNPHWLP